MLTLKNIKKQYVTRRILDGVSFSIGEGQRVALVGQNGVGKSTLLKIIAGIETPDRGEITLKKGTLIGYLPQETLITGNETIREHLFLATGLALLESKMEALKPSLHMSSTQLQYEVLQTQFKRLGGYSFEERAKGVLEGLGLRSLSLTSTMKRLSGGEKRKISLAGVLLRGVDLLLLDEPTNNLDLPALLWLERFLVAAKATLLVASHDRTFLDHVVQKVIEIDFEKRTAMLSTGNWSTFAELKAHRTRRNKELYQAQEEERVRVVESAAEKRNWIEIGKAKQPRDNNKMGRGYKLNRSAQKQGATARALEKRLTRLVTHAKPFERAALIIRLIPKQTIGQRALEFRQMIFGYTKGFQSKPTNGKINFGERVALLGVNGAGKSTFLKTVTGRKKPLRGKVTRTKGVIFGNLMQEHENINQSLTPVEYFAQAHKIFEREQVLSLLATFQFTPLFAETKIGDLSPGERVRFLLATLVVQGANILILDEPTNHLDLEAIEALEDALGVYPGTVLLVTHDRMFLERLSLDTTYLLQEGELTKIDDFGTYAETLATESRRRLKRLEERVGRK